MASDHPLALELSSLKTALDKYQHAAHISSLQLQRVHLEASDAYAHSKLLEAENTRLKEEITVLRDNPEPTHVPREVAELTLALRRVSDKLSHTESILLQRTTELAQAISEKMGMQLEVKASHVEADRIRQAEFECRSRERELKRKCKAAEEEARMADVVVMEYADLVRSMEGRMLKVQDKPDCADDGHSRRSPSPSSPQTRSKTIIGSLTENRYSLQRLLHELNSETSDLQTEITRLHAELSTVQNKLDSERESSRQDRSKLAEALVEVERCKMDDAAAGKLVSRYMRFSQSSIDMLQTALSAVKSRHAMTLATFSSSNEALSQALALERTRAAQLRDILDQLTEDISRETFGRRREVALRLRSVVREEKMSGALSIWLRRAEEHRGAMSATMEPSPSDSSSQLSATLDRMIEDAHALRASLSHSDHPVTDSLECASWERVVFAEHTCRSLLSELQEETEKRLALTRTIGEKLRASQATSQQNIADPGKKSDQVTIHNTPILSEVARTPPLELENDAVCSPIPSQRTMEQLQCPDDAPDREQKEHADISAQAENDDGVERPWPAPDRPDEASSIEEISILTYPPLPLLPSEEERSRQPSAVIDELTVSRRYEHLQRALRDCHIALAHLKTTVTSDSPSHSDKSVLNNVVHRLDDFCEDVRVELEIRMADEERIIRGFETMLRVPGALAVANGAETRRELQSFVDGAAPAVTKAHETFTTKLADLQHDIAQVKRALHDLEVRSEAQLQPGTETSPVWPVWTPFLSTPPKRTSSPAPTFGAVITTPRLNRMATFTSRSSSESTLAVSDPYAHLDLRIPMPSQTHSNASILKSPSKLRNSESSRMYLLGLSGSNGGFVSTQEPIPEAKLIQGSEYDSNTRDNHSDVE